MAELVAAGQGALPRAVGGQRRLDPPRRRRAPDRRAAERVVAVDPRPRGARSCRRPRARHRHRAVQPARPRLPHRGRSPARPTSPRTTSGAAIRGSPGEAFTANLRLVDAVRDDRRRARVPRRGSSRSPGCWRRVRTSSRSRAPSGAATSRRTSARSRVELTADDLARLDAIAPPGVAAGSRYADAAYAYGDSPERGGMTADRLLGRGLRLAGVRRTAALGRRAGLPHRAGRARCRPAVPREPAGRHRPRLRRAGRRAGRRVRRRRRHRPPPGRAGRAAARRAGPAGPLGRRHGQPAARGTARRGARRRWACRRRRSPGCTGRSVWTSARGRRRRSPCRRWPGCSPTATAAAAASRTAAERPCPTTSCSVPTSAPAA